ncbi:EamA/RhaT family transporter [Desulfonema ishimotonii]|uniref:EamA/RhaT family transporter n=1 Tax=Desulfonema ishimotonii TaxID=45657 RepID=A0A401G0G6_9BACT|nr:DMT family transporter [Desulfonema ishimotonii]GBC62715.1 EamA/RhaT family transporter [Desulfonema ishimotonii]
MDLRTFRSNTLLLITATIWGFAFVAQRLGMDHVGPFTFNGVRFALGALSLIPLMLITRKHTAEAGYPASRNTLKKLLSGGLMAGGALFTGASLQQVGLLHTTAGNAGFITGLYVVIVPLMGLFWKQRPAGGTWAGAALAAIGLYFLCITDRFTIAYGDFLELIGAFFWAGHVLLIGWLSPRTDALRLAFVQFVACSVLSLITGFLIETVTLEGILRAGVPILYGGLGSVGIAYTLQVVAQKDAHPAHAAIILSMESPFAALGGWLLLDEVLSGRSLFGCGLMLSGMIVSQLAPYLFRSESRRAEAAL